MKSTLKVYVAEHCPGCSEARNTAVRIRKDYPDVTVRVIDISKTGKIIPDEIFATPTYVLNNQVVSLGNPGPDDIVRWMSKLRTI
jgi:hypothetical protein